MYRPLLFFSPFFLMIHPHPSILGIRPLEKRFKVHCWQGRDQCVCLGLPHLRNLDIAKNNARFFLFCFVLVEKCNLNSVGEYRIIVESDRITRDTFRGTIDKIKWMMLYQVKRENISIAPLIVSADIISMGSIFHRKKIKGDEERDKSGWAVGNGLQHTHTWAGNYTSLTNFK